MPAAQAMAEGERAPEAAQWPVGVQDDGASRSSTHLGYRGPDQAPPSHTGVEKLYPVIASNLPFGGRRERRRRGLWAAAGFARSSPAPACDERCGSRPGSAGDYQVIADVLDADAS